MSRFFLYGTSLGGMEQLMMLAPNFSPRRSGVVTNNSKCKGGVYKCNDCFCFIEKLDADEVEHRDLIKDCFGKIKSYDLKERLKLLSNSFNGGLFLNSNHKKRFYQVHYKQGADVCDRSPSYLAVLFLLTADKVLWDISEHAVCLNGFDFSQIHLRQVSTEGYALYQMAKTIWLGKEYIRISEIADEDLVDDKTFKIIINASLIAKYGAYVFSIKK